MTGKADDYDTGYAGGGGNPQVGFGGGGVSGGNPQTGFGGGGGQGRNPQTGFGGGGGQGVAGGDPAEIVAKALLCFNDKHVRCK